MKLETREGHFWLNGQPTFLIAGELQYFRIDPSLWRSSLAHLQAAGFNAVSSYIPWSWHEPVEGQSDFTSRTHPQRDLIAFLEAVKASGLAFMARPGPFIYAEYEGFGIPNWLGRQHPECVMVRANGRLDRGPFWYAYSLQHPIYQQQVERWYGMVIPILRPYFGEPIITFQIDNETGILHANRLGEIDFNPVAIERFRAWLRHRYGDLEGLNRIWQCAYAAFEAIEPPRRPYCHAHAVDWQRFLEEELSLHLSWLHALAERLGVTVPILHNEQGTHHSPAHISAKCQQVDFQGYDLYVKASGGEHVADFVFGGSIYPSLFKPYTSETRPLLALELGPGWLDPRARVSDAAVVQSIVCALAHGLKGYGIYPAHDGREASGQAYQFGSPLDERGEPTARYDTLQRLHAFLREHESSLLESEELYSPIGYLNYYPNDRFVPEDFILGQRLLDPTRYLAFMGHFGLYALMLTAGVNPRILDLEMTPLEQLQSSRLLVFPNKGAIDPESYETLVRAVESGQTLLTFPRVPQCTLEGHPFATGRLYPHPPTKTTWRHRARTLLSLGWRWGVQYGLVERRAALAPHPTSQHVVDLFEPLLVLLGQTYPQARVATDGHELPADHLLQLYEKGARPLFSWRGKCCGYEAPVGRGRSVVLGTELAGTYVLPQYYTMAPQDRVRLRRWLLRWLEGLHIHPLWSSELEVELVARRSGREGWLFVINRLDHQAGQIQVAPQLGPLTRLVARWSLAGSSARVTAPGQLHVDLAPHDCLMLRVA